MRAQVSFGRSTITFTVERSSRRRTVTIGVTPGGSVEVKAPTHVELDRLQAVVKSKGSWVLQRLAEMSEVQKVPASRQFVSGMSVRYLGRQYRLKLLFSQKRCSVSLRGGYLVVTLDDPKHCAVKVRRLLQEWYRTRARERLPERVALMASRVRVTPTGVLVRDQASRWASCSARGELRFNWRLMMAPMPLVDYVVAHELCHLRIPNHSTAFWKLLGRVLPDQMARRERLRREGGTYSL
ncbi:M48 family metallopeptidase [Archangium lansingense]|uniref:M48 family metallopeptidase n=1 Tax=Archangium lansingense TaxID=2995310 RepID=UPI003B7913F2